MRRSIAVAAAVVAALAVAATASAVPKIGENNNGWTVCEERGLVLWKQGFDQFGGATVGRNLVDDGKLTDHGIVPLSNGEACAWADRLDALLHPPPVPEPVAAPAAPAPPAAATGSGCVGMEAESGSLGYAEPGGDGYIGCYQIAESHYDAGGICEGLGTDPSGQDACASRICGAQGASAWTNPEGENPCGRL